MPYFETVTATEASADRCEDRTAVLEFEERSVIVVADGAGGIGSGDIASESVVREVKASHADIHSADQWAQLLRQIDASIVTGESTGVVVDVRPYGLSGASVGDSQAWLIDGDSFIDLTQNQNRKPLLGSGFASPVAFTHSPLSGLLLMSSDGFCNYAKRDALTPLIAQSDFYAIPRKCIELVRLPSGELWDDVAIAAARIRPKHRTRRKYSI